MSAELAARRTLGAYLESVLAGLGDGLEPDWTAWAHRLAAVLGELLSGLPAAARPGSGTLAAVRAVLDGFDWERDDRQIALERIDQLVTCTRTASGIEPGGGGYLTAADLATVLGGLADAADLLEHRAGQCCPDCAVHPAELCEEHAADLDAAGAYHALARTLGGGL